jgi:transketolase
VATVHSVVAVRSAERRPTAGVATVHSVAVRSAERRPTARVATVRLVVVVRFQALEEDHISVRVINNHTIKPLDELVIRQAAEETGAIVTAEEHQKNGGMGSAIAEFLAEHHPVPLVRIGIDDRFGESGEPQELMQHFGLTSKEIKKAVLKVLRLKGK